MALLLPEPKHAKATTIGAKRIAAQPSRRKALAKRWASSAANFTNALGARHQRNYSGYCNAIL